MILAISFLFLLFPIVFCSWLAFRRGQDLLVTSLSAFSAALVGGFLISDIGMLLCGMIGGLFALVFLEQEEPPQSKAQIEAQRRTLEAQRVAAEHKALGINQRPKSPLTAERKKQLESLLGGKK